MPARCTFSSKNTTYFANGGWFRARSSLSLVARHKEHRALARDRSDGSALPRPPPPGSAGSLRWDLEHPNSLFACLQGAAGSSLLGFTEISATESDHAYVGPWWPHGHNIGWEHGHNDTLRYVSPLNS